MFSYSAPAELFMAATFRRKGAMRYVRFETAADAIRHAMEALPPLVLRATVMEVDEERYNAAAIRELYDSRAYPLTRVI
jgi:hypothetical protein